MITTWQYFVRWPLWAQNLVHAFCTLIPGGHVECGEEYINCESGERHWFCRWCGADVPANANG